MTDIKPMLAENVDPSVLIKHAEDSRYVYQQKLDGIRLMAVVEDGTVTALLNRRGESTVTDVPMSVRRQLATMPMGKWVLDGELIDGAFWLFDLYGTDETFKDRHAILTKLFKLWAPTKAIRLLPVAKTRVKKLGLAKSVLANGGEGIIIRDSNARYKQGIRSSALMKAKFVKDADFIATGLNKYGRSNISIGLLDEAGEVVNVGEVTANAGDGKKVKVGDVITVRYLYCTDDLRIYQPNLPRLRKDKKKSECTLDQLIFVDKRVLTKW